MTQSPLQTPALPAAEVRALSRALSAGDVTVFVDGTALRLPTAARDAVLDLLARLAGGDGVTVGSLSGQGTGAAAAPVPQAASAAGSAATRPEAGASTIPLLTTSQAAAAAGISHTYLRNLTDAGIIPVEYRGTHRRIRLADVEAWLEQQASKGTRGGEPPASGQS